MNRILAAATLAMLAAPSTGAPPDSAPDPAPAAKVDPAAPVPVEAFAELPSFDTPTLSPDGTRLAAKMAVGDRQALVVARLDGKAPPAVMRVGDTVDINWWRWVGDGWLAVGVGAQQAIYGEEYYVTRVVGLSADMKTVNRIDWDRSGLRADDVLWTARDGAPRILLAKQTGIASMEQVYPSVFEADLSTGKVRQVLRGRRDVWTWYADGAGVVRMALRSDDATRKRELLYRAGATDEFRPVAVQRRGQEQGFTTPVVFRADGSAIAIDDADGRDAAYEMSLPDLKLGRRLYGLDRYDIDSVYPNAARDGIDGVGVTDTFARTVWLDPAMAKLQAEADRALAPRRGRFVSWSADRTKFLVRVGTPSQAGALFYWNAPEGIMRRIDWQNGALRGRTLNPVRTVSYQARDGTPIEAVLTLPRGRPARALPVIVMPHGGPFARDAEEWDWWTQYLAEVGYAVIQPNYRGSSGYGAAFARLGRGEWGLKMQDDLDDALAWAAKDGIADPKRACIVGASYGGYAAMRAGQRGGPYRCAVSYAGVSDLGAMQRYDGRFLGGKFAADWLRAQAPDFRAVSPRFGAAAFAMPILVVHGKEDKRVPVRQSRLMVDALRAAGKPVTYLEQPLGDHHFSRGADRLAFLRAMKAFLDTHNPA